MVGCADDPVTGGLSRRKAADDTADQTGASSTTPTTSTGTTSAAVTACSSVAQPTALAQVTDATDLRIAGTAIFFQTGASVNRILKNGANKKVVFTSPNLTHSWADAKGLLLVETTGPDNPSATLRAFAANATETPAAFPEFPVVEGEAGPGGATANTNFNAASVEIFASDENNFYLMADDANGNSLIVAVNRANPATQTVLLTTDKVISNPQIASSAIWYVEDNNRVFKLPLATDDQPAGEKKEVFGVGTQCSLAVNELAAFCSLGDSIEQRDLTGASPKTFMDLKASKTPLAPFGQPMYFDSRLYLRSLTPDKDIKNVIRSVATGAAADEKLVACNRPGTITGIAIDQENVVWSEKGAGVFMTAR